MIKLKVSVLRDQYAVFLIKGPAELDQVSLQTGVPMRSLYEGFGTNPPRALGRTYFAEKVIVICIAGTSNNVISVVRHELGHAVALAMGLDPTSERVANDIARAFVMTGHLMRRIRDILDVTDATLSSEAEALERRFDAGRLPYNDAAAEMAGQPVQPPCEGTPIPIQVKEGPPHADASNSGYMGLFSLMSLARRVEIVVNRDISIAKGPRVVEIRLDTGTRSETLQTVVRSMEAWIELRDAVKHFATERRIPCAILFN